MDPLSLAASVAGLVSITIELSGAIHSYCKAVKDARKDVQEMAQELVVMGDLLHQLEEHIRSPHLKTKAFDQSSVLATALSLCGNSIERISTKVHMLRLDGIGGIWEKLKWPFTEKDMQKALATLRRCAATFQFSLTIEGW